MATTKKTKVAKAGDRAATRKPRGAIASGPDTITLAETDQRGATERTTMAKGPPKSRPANPKAARARPRAAPPAAAAATRLGQGGELQQQAEDAAQRLTTNQGVPISDNQNSLKAGARGPVLLQDFILREKIMHFDHERIPERVVHARGSAAHGFFECLECCADVTIADFLQRPGEKIPIFTRFSTVAGNKARPTSRATCAVSPSSSTPPRATSIWSATTSLSSSSRTRSSSPI